VAPLPADFQDRRVEITGPTDRKMVINALNRWGRCACCARCAAHDVSYWPCQRCLPYCMPAAGAGFALPAAGWDACIQGPNALLFLTTVPPCSVPQRRQCVHARFRGLKLPHLGQHGAGAGGRPPACLPARLPTCLPSVRLLPASAGGVVLLPPTQHPECRHTCFPAPEHPTPTYRSTCVMPCAVPSASRTSAPASSTLLRR
jgi:hypothetical protein